MVYSPSVSAGSIPDCVFRFKRQQIVGCSEVKYVREQHKHRFLTVSCSILLGLLNKIQSQYVTIQRRF